MDSRGMDSRRAAPVSASGGALPCNVDNGIPYESGVAKRRFSL